MNTPKSSETERQVVESYLYGYPTEEISKKYHVSTGYISGVVSRVREDLGTQEVAAIINLTRGWKKIGISPSDVLDAAKIHSILKNFEGNIDDLPSFLSEIHQKCKNEGISVSQIIQYCKQSTQIQERIGLSFEELKEEYSILTDEKIKLDEDILTAKEQKHLSEEDAEIALDKKNLTITDIKEFNNIKEELQDNGVEYKDISKLCKILKQAKQCNYDLEKIINHLEKENNHEEQILQYQNQIKQLETQKKDQSKQNKILSNTLEGKSKLVEIIKKFEGTGIEYIHLENLYEIVIGISRQHNVDKKTAIAKLYDDLQNNYDVVLGLKTQIKSLNDEIDIKSIKLESLDTKIENLKIKHKEEQNIITLLKSLKQKINPHLIITWNNIFEKANLNLQDFEKQLNSTGDLEKIITSKQQTITQLTQEQKELKLNIETLEECKDELESKIKYADKLIKEHLDENLKKTIQQTKEILDIGAKAILKTAKVSQEGITLVSNTAYDNNKQNLEKIQNLIDSAMQVSEKIGRLEFFVPIYDLINGIDSPNLYPVIISILDKFYFHIQKQGKYSAILYDIKSLREKLEREIQND